MYGSRHPKRYASLRERVSAPQHERVSEASSETYESYRDDLPSSTAVVSILDSLRPNPFCQLVVTLKNNLFLEY